MLKGLGVKPNKPLPPKALERALGPEELESPPTDGQSLENEAVGSN